MRPSTIALTTLTAAILIGGCGVGKDEGVSVAAGQGPSSADYDQQIAKVQADTHVPDAAKQAQIGQLQAAKARAASTRK